MKSIMKWAIVHMAVWAVLYGAFFENIEGALYTLKFFIWLTAPLSAFLLIGGVVSTSAKGRQRPVLRALSNIQLSAALVLLVWFGHLFTGLACAAIMAFIAIHRSAVNEARAKR